MSHEILSSITKKASRVGNNRIIFDYEDWGSIHLEISFHVRIDIYKAPDPELGNARGYVTCWFESGDDVLNAWPVAGPETGGGGGFWNWAGVYWGNAVFAESGNFFREPPVRYIEWDDDREELVDLGGAVLGVPGRSETADTSNMSDDVAWMQQNSRAFMIYYYCDNDPSMVLHSSSDSSMTYSRYLYDGDFSSDGSLSPLSLLRAISRSYRHDTPGYSEGSVFEIIDQITTDRMDIDWRYYPWAIKSGPWMSCNRDFSTTPSENRSAYLRIKKNSSWDDVLNSNQGTSQESWVKKNGIWQRALPYGNGA